MNNQYELSENTSSDIEGERHEALSSASSKELISSETHYSYGDLPSNTDTVAAVSISPTSKSCSFNVFSGVDSFGRNSFLPSFIDVQQMNTPVMKGNSNISNLVSIRPAVPSPFNVPYHYVPLVVDNSGYRIRSFSNNVYLLQLASNVYSVLSVKTPEEFVDLSSSVLSSEPEEVCVDKPRVTRSRQRKNYDNNSKHKILQMYEEYSRSPKRMTIRGIAAAICKKLKKENSSFPYSEKNIVTLLYNHRQKRR